MTLVRVRYEDMGRFMALDQNVGGDYGPLDDPEPLMYDMPDELVTRWLSVMSDLMVIQDLLASWMAANSGRGVRVKRTVSYETS